MPVDEERSRPSTTNGVEGSSIGTSVQAQTIFGGVRVQNFRFTVPVLILTAGLLFLPGGSSKPADGTRSTPSAPGIVLEKVSHAFSPDFDRVAVFVRNPATEAVPIAEIGLYLDFDAAHWWHDPSDRTEWHFEIGREMYFGPANRAGARRLHGSVRVEGDEFDLPLAGQGFVAGNGSWRRLLTFSPQAVLPAGQLVELTIDIPTAFAVDLAKPPEPAAEPTEVRFATGRGSLFTHVLVRTPSSVSHACDFLRKDPDPALCDSVDPTAMVNPRR